MRRIRFFACRGRSGRHDFRSAVLAGVVYSVIGWMEITDPVDLAMGGALYGLPVGLVLGVTIGIAIVLTDGGRARPYCHNQFGRKRAVDPKLGVVLALARMSSPIRKRMRLRCLISEAHSDNVQLVLWAESSTGQKTS